MDKVRWEVVGTGISVFGLALVLILIGADVPKPLALGSGGLLMLIGLAITLTGVGVSRRVSVAYWQWRKPKRASTTLEEIVMRGPVVSPLTDEVHFTTNGRDPRIVSANELGVATIPPRGLPTRMDFLSPEIRTIRSGDLPAEIRCRGGAIRITRFVAGGFVVDERGCIGDKVRVDVYFD